MNIVKLLLCAVFLLNIIACTHVKVEKEVIYKDRVVVLEVPNSMYRSIVKPVPFKEDINLEHLKAVEVTDKELITLLLHKYAVEKTHNVACYSTVYNIKKTLKEQHDALIKGNDK